MNRVEDWPERLHEYIDLVQNEPFAWGVFDCCLFAADAVRVITGFDGAASLRGRYSTEAEAVALLAAEDGGLYGYVCNVLGAEKPALAAQRGDVVMLAETDIRMAALGICLGARAAFTGPRGLSMIPLDQCVCSWMV